MEKTTIVPFFIRIPKFTEEELESASQANYYHCIDGYAEIMYNSYVNWDKATIDTILSNAIYSLALVTDDDLLIEMIRQGQLFEKIKKNMLLQGAIKINSLKVLTLTISNRKYDAIGYTESTPTYYGEADIYEETIES